MKRFAFLSASTRPRPAPCRQRRLGTTTVELAFVFPLFFLFVFGLIDVGRGFMASHLLTNAARQACRQSVVQNQSTADVEAAVTAILEGQGIKGHTTVVKVNGAAQDVATAQTTDEICVVVSVPVSSVTWIPVQRFLTGTITGSFSLRREGNRPRREVPMRIRKHSVMTKRRSAAAAVEFAIIATILATITIGLMEMARGMMIKETLSNAARRGCRTAILPTGTTAGVNADVTKVLTDRNLKYEDATVQVLVNDKTADASTAVQNDKIAVKVSIPVSKVTWITPFFFSSSSIESEAVVMMRQR